MATPTPDGSAPNSTAEKALAAVPVALTVLTTILAGLSSSEMTRSQYFRSLAAQDQAKAGAQWGFFQAKKIRGTPVETSADLRRVTHSPPPLDARLLSDVAGRLTGL